MIFIFLSIICSSLLTILFKVFERFNINTFQAIVVNYLSAAAIAFCLSTETQTTNSILKEEWFFAALTLGILFIGLFNAIAFTAQKIGVTVATVANKMSLIIPVIAAIIFHNASFDAGKIIGILMALVAIYLSTYRNKSGNQEKLDKKYFLIPLIVFIGSGTMDTIINYAQANFLQPTEYEIFLAVVFGIAGTIGLIILLGKVFFAREQLSFKSVVAGLLLGTVNYGSMYGIVMALSSNVLDAAVFFPVNNIGIVAFSAISAYFLFREKLSLINWIGILLCIVSIITVAL